VRPTATLVLVVPPTPTGAVLPTIAPTATAKPTEGPPGGGEVPDTGGSFLPLIGASAAFAMLLFAARKGRHQED
jgi:hypothetical protein